MSGPIHFVDITGTLQKLGPGAHIQFNGQDGTRREIVLVHPDTLSSLYQNFRSELASVDKRLSDKIKSDRLFSMANEENLESLARAVEDYRADLSGIASDVSANDRWSTAKTSALFDYIQNTKTDLSNWCTVLQRVAIGGAAFGIIGIALAIISFFV